MICLFRNFVRDAKPLREGRADIAGRSKSNLVFQLFLLCCPYRASKRGKADPIQQAEANGDGGNGAGQKEPAADGGVERGVDEGQDVYVSGGNNDDGEHAV